MDLMDENQITPNKLVVSCKLQGNAFTKWKSGFAKPSLDSLIKIADYFNVSLDYLVGREQQNTANLTITKNQIASTNDTPDGWDKLDEIQRSKVNGIIQGMLMADIRDKSQKAN